MLTINSDFTTLKVEKNNSISRYCIVLSKGARVEMDASKKINVEKDMRALVAEILETEPESLDLNAKFVKDLGMDSMMALEILAGIEKKYRIVIPEDMLSKFIDLSATVKLVSELLAKNKKI